METILPEDDGRDGLTKRHLRPYPTGLKISLSEFGIHKPRSKGAEDDHTILINVMTDGIDVVPFLFENGFPNRIDLHRLAIDRSERPQHDGIEFSGFDIVRQDDA
jgi:hypothetical protein